MSRSSSILSRLGLHRPELRAWALYDWANSAFVLVIITAVFPIYYKNVPAAELSAEDATAYYGWVTTAVLFLIAILSPSLGALADFRAWRKKFLGAGVLLGVIATACMVFLHQGDWLAALILFGLGNLGLASSFTFYDSLLPHIAAGDEIDRVSTGGYALGYLGSGLLLVLNLLWIQMPETWGFEDTASATRAAFLSVAVWWLLFSLPLFRKVSEPPRQIQEGERNTRDAVRVALGRLKQTISEMR
ncbi:MAG: MFS transporter, partial [Ignavibacteria bacterium]|nr:MFS transporter [Ignavibacteria bacterium]